MPNEKWYFEIHERMLAADPVASAELAEASWKPLVRILEKKYPQLRGSDFVRDAATDALISYIENPTQFDPAKRGLFGFLVMAAEGDLRNALAKATRRKRREVSIEDVEVLGESGNERLEAPEQGSRVMIEGWWVRACELFTSPRDREAVGLLLLGERATKAFAKAWGLEGLPARDQAREVKRNKDRIKKMLQRRGLKGDGSKRQT